MKQPAGLMYKLQLSASPAWTRALESLQAEGWEILSAPAPEAAEEISLSVVEVSDGFAHWRDRLKEAIRKEVPVLALYRADQPQLLQGPEVKSAVCGGDLEWFPVRQWDAGQAAALKRRLALRASVLDLKKKLQDQRRRQQARESLVQKLVHDMKSPLTVMLMDLGLLERWWEKGNSERFRIGVGRVTQNCEELIGMIQNLLDANRLRTQEMRVRLTTLGLGSVLREVLDNPPSSLEKKNISMQLDLRDTDTSLEMDGPLMGRIVSNLLRVAARMTRKGGRVDLLARKTGRQMEFEVRVPQASFAAEEVQSLLEPYAHEKWATLGVDAGNGIGFNFSRMAAERQGGTLKVEGRESGVAFVARFPVSARQL